MRKLRKSTLDIRKPLTTYILGPADNNVAIIKVKTWYLDIYPAWLSPLAISGKINGFSSNIGLIAKAAATNNPSQILLYWSAQEYMEGPAWLDLIVTDMLYITLKFSAVDNWIKYP